MRSFVFSETLESRVPKPARAIAPLISDLNDCAEILLLVLADQVPRRIVHARAVADVLIVLSVTLQFNDTELKRAEGAQILSLPLLVANYNKVSREHRLPLAPVQ